MKKRFKYPNLAKHPTFNPGATVRVLPLYRVSNPSQIKEASDVPIPAQQDMAKILCSNKVNWVIVDEIVEPGVSAFRNSALDRDVLQEVLKCARQKTFDVLLIYKSSRLSRREEEYPDIIAKLARYDVIVWEVDRDKRLTPLNHDEALTTYIDGWQANGESENISAQTRAGKISKALRGGFPGGSRGYGFEVIDKIVTQFRGKAKIEAVWGIQPKEAELINKMVEFYEMGHGSKYIARILNEQGYRTRNGAEWHSQYIRRILRNPAIAGISLYRIDGIDPRRIHCYKDLYDPSYHVVKNEKGEYISDPKLTIIEQDRWFRLQNILDTNKIGTHQNPNPNNRLLLSGFIICGYCGRKMSGVTASETYKKKDGTTSIYNKTAYRCASQIIGLTCDGPYQIKNTKIDDLFYIELEDFFSHFDPESLLIESEEDMVKDLAGLNNQAREVEKSLIKVGRIKERWLNELDELFSRNGDYILSKSDIMNRIGEQDLKLKSLTQEKQEIQRQMDSVRQKRQSVNTLSKVIPQWYDEFVKQPLYVQNQLLRHIIDKVVLFRDHIEINYKIDVNTIADRNNGAATAYLDIQKTINLA